MRRARDSKSPVLKHSVSPRPSAQGRKTLSSKYSLNRSHNNILRPFSPNTVSTTPPPISESTNKSFILPSGIKSISKFQNSHQIVGIREEIDDKMINKNSPDFPKENLGRFLYV